MKKTKFLASLMSVAMLVTTLSTTLVSAATTTDPVTTSANLTIHNSIKGTGISIKDKTYNLYQVFSATTVKSDDGKDDTIEYIVNPNFYDFFADKLVDGTEIGAYPTALADSATDAEKTKYEEDVHAYNHKATEYVKTFVDETTTPPTDNKQKLVTLLRNYIADDSSFNVDYETIKGATSGDGDEEHQVAENVNLGYYVIFDSLAISGTASENDAVTNGWLMNIPGRSQDGSLTANVTIELKGSMPSIDKDIWHNDIANVAGDKLPDGSTKGSWDSVADYQIGDTVEFLLTVTVPKDVSAYETYDFIITDTLSKGLKLNQFTNANGTKPYTRIYQKPDLSDTPVSGNLHNEIFTDGEGKKESVLVMNFDMLNIKKNFTSLEKFYIYYTATVTEDAVISPSYEKNKVQLDFSNNPYDDTSKGKDEDEVYGFTFDLDVLKTTGDGITALAGAKFALYEQKMNANEEPENVQIYLEQDTDITLEVPRYYPAKGTASDDLTNPVGIIETDAKGKFTISGLDDAKNYVLIEIQAPDGFNKADPIEIKISASYTYEDELNEKNPTPSITVSGDTDSLDFKVINTSASLLPETGGIGTTIFTISGIVLMLGAVALLIVKKSKKSAQ